MSTYATILADPPWDKSDRGTTVKPRNWSRKTPGWPVRAETSVKQGRAAREIHYATLSEEVIAAVPVNELAAERAHLWLWSLNATMETAYRVIRAWGFEPHGVVTWRKVTNDGSKDIAGMGHYFRLSTEQLIFAVRGVPATLPEKPWYGTCISAPRGQNHSRKPDAFYDLIEHVSAAPRLELFARARRLGWDSWGDEVDSDVEISVA